MPDGPSLGTAYVRVAADMSQVQTQAVGLFSSSKWGKIGKVAGGALAAGLVAGGALKALYDIGEGFDDLDDKIRVKTGASGKKLDQFGKVARNVFRSLPTDLDTAGDAVAGLAQRLDLTGKPLQRLSKQVVELSRITGTDVNDNVQTVSRAFADWEVKTSKQSKTLDYFFKASQQSGASVSELAQQVVQFGAPLRQVGFRLDEATSMFALFEKAGVNTQTMMPGLRMALRNFLEQDIDPRKGLMRAFSDIEDGSMKASEAIDLFGARAGADMIEAIQQGRFDLEKFTKSIKDNEDTIRGAGRETMDFSEQWQRFKNMIVTELEPVASRVFKGISKLMREITLTFRREGIEGVFDLLLEKLSGALSKAVEIAAAQGPKIAKALIEGFLNAGVWGAVAGAGLIWKILGGVGAMRAAATKAGGTMATSLGAGLKAGLGRAGIAAAIVGTIEAVFTSGGIKDALEGKGSGEILGEKFGANFIANFSDELERAIDRKSLPALQRLSKQTDNTIAAFEEMGLEVPQELRDMSERANAAMDRTSAKMGDLREDAKQLRRGFADSWGQIRSNLDDNLDRIKDSMGTKSKAGQKLIAENFDAAQQSIKRAMHEGYIGVDKGGQLIEDLIRRRLNMLGIKGPDASKLLSAGSAQAQGLPAPPGGKQLGGLVGLEKGSVVPGVGSGDKVPLHVGGKLAAMVEPGELVSVANRKATEALMGVNKAVPRFQKGGVADFPHFSSPYFAFQPHAEQLNRLSDAAEKLVQNAKPSPPPGGPSSKGPDGIGSWMGVPMANWVIESLAYAAKKGVKPQPTSGYRSHAYNVAQGRTYFSEHEGTRYPHGAVDFGGYTTGLTEKMAVVGATRDFKYPLLAPIGFRDDGHASGTGHQRGGIVGALLRLAGGGVIGRPIPKALQKYNHLYAKHVSPDFSGETMPRNAVAMLAQFFGMPGLGMAAIASRESGFRPGAVGDDAYAGFGNTFGYGLWQITNRASGLDSYVNSQFGGYDKLLNPIANAIVAAKMFKAGGYGPWGGPIGGGDWSGDFGPTIGASGSSSGGGPKKPPKPPKSTLSLTGTLGYQHLPKKLKEALLSLRKKTVVIEEQITNAETLSQMLASEAGADLGPGEKDKQVSLYTKLLTTLIDRVANIKKGINFAPGGPRAGRLRSELEDLQGKTGAGGQILQVQAALDSLAGTTTGGGVDWELIASLRGEQLSTLRRELGISHGQMPVFQAFANAPVMHSGGVVPGAPGTNVPIVAQAGETVTPAGGAPVIHNHFYIEGEEIRGISRQETQREIANQIRSAKSGPTIGRTAVGV